MKLRAIMNRYPQTISANEPLSRARDLMVWGGYRHVPVINMDSGKVVGILSDRDIAKFPDLRQEDTVAMAMSSTVHTADPDSSLTEAAARMAAEKIGCLPITELGKLIGIVTITDVLTAQVRIDMNGNSGTSVGEVMTAAPKTVHPEDHLLDAAARMRQYGIRHLPVVDGENRVVGMLSDRDVRAAIGDPARAFDEKFDVAVNLMRVSDAMSTPAMTTTTDQSCASAARAFVDLRASAVPVVDQENVLVGVVSYVDVLRAFSP